MALLGLLSLGVFGAFGLLPRPGHAVPAGAAEVPEAAPGGAAAPAVAAPAGSAAVETVQARQILVQYTEAWRSDKAHNTLTLEQAEARANDALAKLRKGEDFGKVFAEYSNSPETAVNQGVLPPLTRKGGMSNFTEAAFALKPGEYSAVIHTPFGFHIIQRTK